MRRKYGCGGEGNQEIEREETGTGAADKVGIRR